MKCSHCAQTDGQVKVGHTTSGSQRYLCKACGHKYTPKPQGDEEAVRQQASLVRRWPEPTPDWSGARHQLQQQHPQYRSGLADFLYP